MDIHHLRTVLLVKAHGSFAGAARILDVDPSSISRLVATTEAALGIRLFQRSTRRLSITDEGRAYLERLEPLLDELEALQHETQSQQRAPSGVLRVTTSVAFAERVLLPILPKFHEAYPQIRFELTASDLNLDLIEHGIDLAIRLAPAPTGDLISTRLMPTRYHVVATTDYLNGRNLTTPHDLSDANCLCYAIHDMRDTWRFHCEGESPFEVNVAGNLSISNPLALRRAAKDGMGIAMLADWMVADDLRERKLVNLFPHMRCAISSFDTSAWMLYPNRSYLPQRTRVLIDFLRHTVGRNRTN